MKNANSIKIATSFVVGALFAAGLIISGMTDPTVIAGFFDFAGNWMPALLFVMVGAVAIHAPLTYFITKKSHPLFDKKFYLSDRLDIDAPLVIGAIFFGLGWGIAGYCPGPAIVTLGTGSLDAILFCGSMLVGMHISTRIRFAKK
ncbi:MAG: YeeE/YedE family protein [Bdellovibrionales bacterium]|nr:YeeE/YedE family protein [Bdellovibrionales bacterium]